MTVDANTKILIVEDNPLDVQIIKMALKHGGVSREATVVDDGGPAIALLERAQEEHELLPGLVILDLNLKQVDGPKVLMHIRQSEGLRSLCVAVLSSSPLDVMQERAAKADCYFTKPGNLDAFLDLGREIIGCYSNRKRAGQSITWRSAAAGRDVL